MTRHSFILMVTIVLFSALHAGQSSSKPSSPRGINGKVERRRSGSKIAKLKGNSSGTVRLCSQEMQTFLNTISYPQAEEILFNFGIDLDFYDLQVHLQKYQEIAVLLAQNAHEKSDQIRLYTFLGHYCCDVHGTRSMLQKSQIKSHLEDVEHLTCETLVASEFFAVQENVTSLFEKVDQFDFSKDFLDRQIIMTQLLEAAQDS